MGGSSAQPRDVLGASRKTQQAIRWQTAQDTLHKMSFLKLRWSEWPPTKTLQLMWLEDMARTVNRLQDTETQDMLRPALHELRLAVERQDKKDGSPERTAALRTMFDLQLRAAWHRARLVARAEGIGSGKPPLRCVGCGGEDFEIVDTYDPHPRSHNPRTQWVCRRCRRPLDGLWWDGRRRDLTGEVRRQVAWFNADAPPPTVPHGTTPQERLEYLTHLEGFLKVRHDVPGILGEINLWLGRIAAQDADWLQTLLMGNSPLAPLISAIGSHSRTPTIWRPAVRKLERTLHVLAFQARWEATPAERRHPACPYCGHQHTFLASTRPRTAYTCRGCGRTYWTTPEGRAVGVPDPSEQGPTSREQMQAMVDDWLLGQEPPMNNDKSLRWQQRAARAGVYLPRRIQSNVPDRGLRIKRYHPELYLLFGFKIPRSIEEEARLLSSEVFVRQWRLTMKTLHPDTSDLPEPLRAIKYELARTAHEVLLNRRRQIEARVIPWQADPYGPRTPEEMLWE